MKHRAHQVCAYVPRKPRKERLAHAGKLLLLAVLGVVLGLVLSGCKKRTEDADGNPISATYDPVPYADRATGCQYLATGNAYALTPRIAADGKTHLGCKMGGAK